MKVGHKKTFSWNCNKNFQMIHMRLFRQCFNGGISNAIKVKFSDPLKCFATKRWKSKKFYAIAKSVELSKIFRTFKFCSLFLAHLESTNSSDMNSSLLHGVHILSTIRSECYDKWIKRFWSRRRRIFTCRGYAKRWDKSEK